MKKILIVFILSLSPTLVSGHNNGVTLEKNVGDYFVDIGVMPHGSSSTIYAKDQVYFEFKLFTSDKNSLVEFTELTVTIKKGKTEIFNQTLKQKGVFFMNYTFEERGGYTLDVTYASDEKKLVQTDFPLVVEEVLTPIKKYGAIFVQALPVIIGWPLVMYYGYREYRHRKQRKEKQPTE